MRKLIVLLGVLAVLTVGLVPVMAQDQTIVEIAAGNPDFSTLVAAVQAAGLVETLSGEGPFTVFAPTNAAFEALGADTVAAALADNALLTAVLTYHVVPGKLFIGQVSASETLTTVQGSDITVTKRDGQLFLNDNVAFVVTDIEASNGIIHVIDTVLLPPAEGAAAEPAPAAEPAGDTVKIRVAHFSPDAPAVDVYIDGVKSDIQGLAFPEITPWIEVPAGTYNIAVAPAGLTIASAILPPADFELPAGAWITVAAIGTFDRGRGSFTAQVIVEDYSPIPEGSARVTVFHAIDGAPTVDVKAGGAAIVSVLAYPGKLGSNDGVATLDVPAGTYDLSVTPTGSDYPIILDLPGTTLEANNHYFVAAVGTPTEPGVALAVTPGS
jgi:uncharacterized surface protein with fasciclin (FAS1) repeats